MIATSEKPVRRYRNLNDRFLGHLLFEYGSIHLDEETE